MYRQLGRFIYIVYFVFFLIFFLSVGLGIKLRLMCTRQTIDHFATGPIAFFSVFYWNFLHSFSISQCSHTNDYQVKLIALYYPERGKPTFQKFSIFYSLVFLSFFYYLYCNILDPQKALSVKFSSLIFHFSWFLSLFQMPQPNLGSIVYYPVSHWIQRSF